MPGEACPWKNTTSPPHEGSELGIHALLETPVVKRQLAGLDGGLASRGLGAAGGLLLAATAIFVPRGRRRDVLGGVATAALAGALVSAYPHRNTVEELRPPPAPTSVAAFFGDEEIPGGGRVFSPRPISPRR